MVLGWRRARRIAPCGERGVKARSSRYNAERGMGPDAESSNRRVPPARRCMRFERAASRRRTMSFARGEAFLLRTQQSDGSWRGEPCDEDSAVFRQRFPAGTIVDFSRGDGMGRNGAERSASAVGGREK